MPQYFLRFDDLHPRVNWGKWYSIEKLLKKFNLKVCIGVIPNNQDLSLYHGTFKEDFWQYVQYLQAQGHTIAMHGETHVYRSIAKKNLINIKKYKSEFTGLDYQSQYQKIQNGLEIFKTHNIFPKIFIAPGHAFDEITLKALNDSKINIISDGFYFRPIYNKDIYWIPCQIWRFHRMPFGYWTICLHADMMSDQDIVNLEENIEKYRQSVYNFDLSRLKAIATPLNSLHKIWSWGWTLALAYKNLKNE